MAVVSGVRDHTDTQPVQRHSPAPPDLGFEPDELDVWYFRHRKFFLLIYLSIFALIVGVSSIEIGAIPELPHILFQLSKGDSQALLSTVNDLPVRLGGGVVVNLSVITAYVFSQAVVLWGVGAVNVQRRSHSGRTTAAICFTTAIGGLVAIGALCLLVVATQTASNQFGNAPLFEWLFVQRLSLVWMIVSGWLLWLVLAAIYWFGRDRSRVVQRLVRALLATSWIEFSLALPIDIAARNRESCFCAIGSYVTLLVAFPVLIWSVGPALYLLYLRERELSLALPGRARKVLRQKSRRYRQRPTRKGESYVSSARTISLALIALGFVGLQLGLFNYQRGGSFADTRDLILIRTLKETFDNDAGLRSDGENRVYTDSSLGKVEITLNTPPPLPADGQRPISFSAKVSRNEETWQSKSFSLDRPDNGRRLERALAALSIADDNPIAPDKLIQKVEEAIYSRRVKLPSVDFGDFGTESAAWLVTLLCVAALVALRNVVHQIFRSTDTGIAEAWLVLDARVFGEKVIAGIWIAGIGLSAWLSTFGLILTVMDVFALATPRPTSARVIMVYVGFAALMALSTWAATGTVADILRLRELRRMLDGTKPL